MLRAIKFLNEGKGKLRLQVYLPFASEPTSVSFSLDDKVVNLKRRLIIGNGNGTPTKTKGKTQPKPLDAKRQETALKTHSLKLVGVMHPWERFLPLDDDATLRDIPFIYQCWSTGVTPRLLLQKETLFQTKQNLQRSMLMAGGDAGASLDTEIPHLNSAEFKGTSQLQDFRKAVQAVAYRVDMMTESIKPAHSGILLRLQSFCSQDLAPYRCTATSTSEPVQAELTDVSRFTVRVHQSCSPCRSTDGVAVNCSETTRVQDVIDEFVKAFDDSVLSTMAANRELVLKRHRYSNMLHNDDLLCSYDIVYQTLQRQGVVDLTLEKSSLLQCATAAIPVSSACPHELRLLVKDLHWLNPTASTTVDGEAEATSSTQANKKMKNGVDNGAPWFDNKMVSMIPGSREHIERLERDPWCELDRMYSGLLWSLREEPTFQANAAMLPKMILSVQRWDEPSAVKDAYNLLRDWERLPPGQALQLLDANFWALCSSGQPIDVKRVFRPFKEYAIQCLAYASDLELQLYMLELCKLLRNETGIQNSPLVSCVPLERATMATKDRILTAVGSCGRSNS